MRNKEALLEEQISYVAGFKSYKSKRVSSSAKAFLNTARDVAPDRVKRDLQLHV